MKTISTIIKPNEILHFKIGDETANWSVEKCINEWQHSEVFRLFFNQILADCPFAAFFWEVKPMAVDTLQNDFEFVLVNSISLVRIKADVTSFESYFENNNSVVTFKNLGRDAQLIVPVPIIEHQYYSHMAQFVRNAPANQIHDFWKMVGEELKKNIGNAPKWLSTAGLGVSWLHVRLDSRPKYYRYQLFKK